MFFSLEYTMLELSKADTPLPSDLSLFFQMLGTQTESMNFSSDTQQEEKTQHTTSEKDKKSEKEQRVSKQSLP